MYYLREGTGDGRNKWFIHHEGGGWCESLEACLERSKTDLGSSSQYKNTISMDFGYFSVNPAVNPQMHNWSLLPHTSHTSHTSSQHML